MRADLRVGLPGGRRALKLEVGPFAVVVMEVPGVSLTDAEWRQIEQARRSYARMWGNAGAEILVGDPLDGRDGGPYEAWHYLAWVGAGAGPKKLLVMRKARWAAGQSSMQQPTDSAELVPFDVRAWRIDVTAGGMTSLSDALRAWARRQAPKDANSEQRIAVMGRIATIPFGERPTTALQRDRTAAAFAAIQLLATHEDPSLAYVWTLCRELEQRVMAVLDIGGHSVAPAFTPTEEVLELSAGSIALDLRQPEVQAHKLAAPGYFVDHDDAAELLARLLNEGLLTLADLQPAIASMVAEAPSWGGAGAMVSRLVGALAAQPDHRAIAEVLTHPRAFKYLSPVLLGAEPLERMSAADLRTKLLWETGHRPFSSTVLPQPWRDSLRKVVGALEERFGSTSVDLSCRGLAGASGVDASAPAMLGRGTPCT